MRHSISNDAYDELADAYAAQADTKPHNAYYERPATMSLIEEVDGKKILDAGCGPGVYSKWLLDRGAQVVSIDASEKMLSHARQRTENRAICYHANMEDGLPFLDSSSFDGILSTLAVGYVRDQKALFAEFHRLLRKGGWFIFSTDHPFSSYQFFKLDNYFETQEISCYWTGFGKRVLMPGYYHSLGTICEALSKNGFVIETVLEPKPTEDFRAFNVEKYERLMKFPLFMCIKARKLA
ncbi:MAG TPA: class I SAM-dependent methyltransferase [Methanothrix sp.]|nr:class I SAM-dependent methyltransferase [Methanothrix sp.]